MKLIEQPLEPVTPRPAAAVGHITLAIVSRPPAKPSRRCPTCGVPQSHYASMSAFGRHVGEHKRRFQCRHCGKRFKQKTHRDLHAQTRHGA